MNAALQSASILLVQLGPELTSIPAIADHSGVPRASIYQFFSDKYQLFARLAEIHLGEVELALRKAVERSPLSQWEELAERLIEAAAAYYNANEVASILVLGGPFSRSGFLAQEVTTTSMGGTFRELFATTSPALVLPRKPDVATFAVEIAFACMKHGYYRDGKISKSTRGQALTATVAYLATWSHGSV